MSRLPQSQRRRRVARRGVTRFELLVGAGVLGTIITVVAFASGVERRGSDRTDAVRSAKVVLKAAQDWRQEQQLEGCPTLSQLVADDALDPGADMDDSWGNRFRIRCDDGFSVESAGEDGESHTPDDVRVTGN